MRTESVLVFGIPHVVELQAALEMAQAQMERARAEARAAKPNMDADGKPFRDVGF